MSKNQWEKYAKKHLVGRKIVAVRYMRKSEADDMGWYKRPLLIGLDDDTLVYASSDDEGNNGGALFGLTNPSTGGKEDLVFPVL